MSVGPYTHMIPVPVNSAAMESYIPPHVQERARRIARGVFAREQLRTSWNRLNGELQLYRCPKHDGYPIIYTACTMIELEHTDTDILIENLLREVRMGKRPRRIKEQWRKWREYTEKQDTGRERDQRDEDQFGDVVHRQIYLRDRRGMGRRWRRSHLIDQNPLAR